MTDGWTIRTRIETFMLTGSVTLWQSSPLYGYWFRAVQDGVHYVSFYKVCQVETGTPVVHLNNAHLNDPQTTILS